MLPNDNFKTVRISTRVVIDMESMQVIERDSYEYSGPLELATGVVGTGVSSPSAQLINTLDSISQKLLYPKLGDLVFKPSPVFWFLNQYCKKFRQAGAEIVYPLITQKITTRGSYYGDQLLSVAAIDAIQPANQLWRFYFTSVALPRTDIILGQGGYAGIDLVKSYMQIGAGSMLDMLAEAVWGNAPFNSATDLDNIPNWVNSTTNTIAGINRTTTPIWAPASPQTVGGHLTPTTLLPAYWAVTFGYDEPNVLILNNTDFSNFELQFVNNSSASATSTIVRATDNITDTAPIQTGLRYHMRFKNLVVLADQHLAAGTGYILNTQYIWLIYNMLEHFTITPWIMPSNQDVISTRIHLATQLGCNRPLANIALTSIS